MSPRAGLDTPTVVQAAVELLNREGLEALSLNRLAAQLGVQTPSLYNHVGGLAGLRQELARLNAQLLAERMAEAAIGKSGAEGLMAIAEAFRAYIKENPGLYLASTRVSGNQETIDPELEAAEERALRTALAVVTSLGLNGEDALHAVRGLRSVVHGFATLEIGGGFGMPLDCDESFRRLVEMLVHGLQTVALQIGSDQTKIK